MPPQMCIRDRGYEITGSDVGEGDIVEREKAMGIPVYHGHRAENVHGAQLAVSTAAILKLSLIHI